MIRCGETSSYAARVAAEVEPPELAQLLDFAERPHVDNWSLRAALVRYAQPQPQRVEDLLDLVRRIQAALGAQSATFQRDGDALWTALEQGQPERAAQIFGDSSGIRSVIRYVARDITF